MKLKHTKKKSANRTFLKGLNIPKGVSDYGYQMLFRPKFHSKTQTRKRELNRAKG